MIPIAAVIVAATAGGLGAERLLGERAESGAQWLMKLMLWLLYPVVIFFNVGALELGGGVGAGIGFAYLALATTLGAAYAIGTWLLHLSRPAVGAMMLAAGLANTGYLGLPFSAALLGFDELPRAIAYDVAVSGVAFVTVGFAIGAVFGPAVERPRDQVLAFLRNPPLWAAVAGLVAPAVLTPEWAVDASQQVVYALLPIGFFVVGVTLARETQDSELSFPPPLSRAVAVAVGLRLALAPAIVLGLSTVAVAVPDAYVSQAAMASAINGVVIAHRYDLDAGLVAGAIAWSTTVVVTVGLAVTLL